MYAQADGTWKATANQRGSSQVTSEWAGAVGVGNWYMMGWSYNGSTKKITLFINGSAQPESSAFGGSGNDPNRIFIGARPSSGATAPDIWVDEVAFWRRTLNETEMTELYNSEAGLRYPFSAPSSPLFDINIQNENMFNATINGTVWTTTNGTINTNHTDGIANITIYANNYWNKTYQNYNLSNDLTTNLSKYPKLNVYNKWNGSQILAYNITIDNSTYTTINGDIYVSYNESKNVTVEASNYVTQTEEAILLQDTTYLLNDLYQSILNLSSTEITTGNRIVSWNISTLTGNYGTTSTYLIIYPNIANYTWNWTFPKWYFNVTGVNVVIDQANDTQNASGFWARNITFQSNLTSLTITPTCNQSGNTYNSYDYLMPNDTTDIACTLTGFQDTTFTLNSTPDSSVYKMEPAMLWLIFDQSTTGYVETEDCNEYPANCQNFTGTNVFIQQSNLSIGKVSVKFNPEANTSNYQQVFEYENTNNTHIKEYIKIIEPDLVQQVKVTGVRSPLEDARVTALNLGQNPDTNATDWLTVFADFTTVDGFATLLLNDEDTYKICAQATGYTTKCEIHYIAPASTETILIDLDPTLTTAGHNFIATSCPNYYTQTQSCTLEVNTYQSYQTICINYTSATLNTTSCDSNSVTKNWAYSLTNTTGNISIEVSLDGVSTYNISHIYETYDPEMKIEFEEPTHSSGLDLRTIVEGSRTYQIVMYLILLVIAVIMGFMAEKYFNGYGLYGAGVWFLFLAFGKLYIFWIPVLIIGFHAIVYQLLPLFKNR